MVVEWDLDGIYPLVMTTIAIEAMARSKVREFSHENRMVIFCYVNIYQMVRQVSIRV